MSLENRPSSRESQDMPPTINPLEVALQAEKELELINLLEAGKRLDSFISTIESKQWDNLLQSSFVQAAAQQRLINELSMGGIYKAQEIIDTFKLSDDIIRPAVKQGLIKCIYANSFESIQAFITTFKLTNDIVYPAAEQYLTNRLLHGFVDDAQEFISTLKLPKDVVDAAAKQCLFNYLSWGSTDDAQKIIVTYKLPDDIVQGTARQVLINCLSENNICDAQKIITLFPLPSSDIQSILKSCKKDFLALVWGKEMDFGLSKSEKDAIYTQEIETLQSKISPEVKSNLQWLENNLGQEKTRQIFQSKLEFWTNPHDTLLFVEKLQGLAPSDLALIKHIVLLPLLNQETDLAELNKLIGSFDVQLWLSKHSGVSVPFVSWAQFAREVQMQIHHIVVPDNASEQFHNAVHALIAAPGVDVPFIRLLIDTYRRNNINNSIIRKFKNKLFGLLINTVNYIRGSKVHNIENESNHDDYDNKGNSEDYKFARRLIKIIEGADRIDERQLIKPWREVMSMDPLHHLVLTAVGIHGLNSQTLPLTQAWQKKDMAALLGYLVQINEEIKKNIETEYEQKIAQEKDRRVKDKLMIEKQKTLRTNLLLKYNSSNTPEGINIDNRSNYKLMFDSTKQTKIKDYLQSSISHDPELKKTIVNILHTFAVRGKELFNCVDLNSLAHLVELAIKFDKKIQTIERELSLTITDKKELHRAILAKITPEDILAIFQDRELDLTELLLYFGLNNKTRQSQSKDIKKSLDKILRQKTYQDKLDKISEQNKDQTIVKDPFIAYIKGILTIESDDENSIRDILKNYGYADIGRTLVMQIAKKSDPNGWVCGDYTDCCMPFTSDKNREYLLREDLAYFLLSIQNNDGSKKIIAQSVLVSAQDKDHHPEVAIDNIEIANKAIKYREVIAKAYQNLKEELASRYQNQKFKIVIGTSYNDDGGVITGDCVLSNVDAQPIMGNMYYSDWAGHSSNYVYYDSDKKSDNREKYFGLQIDLFANSKVKPFIKDNEELTRIKTLLEKIGQGEDDGDNGLIFPDNYSVVIEQQKEVLGYIIGADYIKQEEENDLLILEEMRLKEDLPIERKQALLHQYLSSKNPQANDNIHGLHIQSGFLAANPFATQVITSFFTKNCTIRHNDDHSLTVTFAK